MRNEYLNVPLEVLIVRASSSEKYKEILAHAFYKLSKRMTEYMLGKKGFAHLFYDDLVQEGVMICFDVLHRYDPTKCSAFNFFTINILGHFRQLYRTGV
jgi:DNA-directed RNA polymerase specialized sigma subunit